MALPNVNINLGNGGLGKVAQTSDGVAGLILTGTAVEKKLMLNTHYLLSSTADLVGLGITKENNPLIDKEVKAFYAQAGEGAELHLLVVSQATTLTQMCASDTTSPLCQLIDAAGGRIRLVGVNKIAGEDYEADVTEGIDGDAVVAAAAAQKTAESYAKQIRPFRVLMPATAWNGKTDKLFKPAEASYNRVAFVLASDQAVGSVYPAAIGMVLGRAALAQPQQSIGRFKFGSLAPKGYFTSGDDYLSKSSMAESLHDAGYLFFISIPTKNGCYLNGDHTAAAATDDYSELHLGRIIDKAMVITYATYINEILDNVEVDDKGALPAGVCKNFEGMIENAINTSMANQISDFSVYINPEQNILSSGILNISCKIVPLGVLNTIQVNLAFENPALQ